MYNQTILTVFFYGVCLTEFVVFKQPSIYVILVPTRKDSYHFHLYKVREEDRGPPNDH